MSLGERLRSARDNKGLKQSELAELIEVKSSGVISNWEKDINKPDADKIIRLCEVLEIPASYLLDYYGNTVNVTLEEQEHIKKYRNLDEHGKKMVDFVLDEEYTRCTQKSQEIQMDKMIKTLQEAHTSQQIISQKMHQMITVNGNPPSLNDIPKVKDWLYTDSVGHAHPDEFKQKIGLLEDEIHEGDIVFIGKDGKINKK